MKQESIQIRLSSLFRFLNVSNVLAILLTNLSILLISSVTSIKSLTGSTYLSQNADEWKITFYTGSKVWAGTDSDIYFQLHGDLGNSHTILIKPKSNQLEAQSVDTFSISNIDIKKIGNLKSITVGKQITYAFFNDWELIKIELLDPVNKKEYTFLCNCWLTTLKHKRTLELAAYKDLKENNERNLNLFSLSYNLNSSRLFPITILLLFLIVSLLTFSYFANVMCKKWRENSGFFMNRRPRLNHHSSRMSDNSNARRANQHSPLEGRSTRLDQLMGDNTIYTDLTNNDLYKEDEDGVTNSNRNRLARNRGLNEDKPPDYKELFPFKNSSNNNNISHQATTSANSIQNNNQDQTQIAITMPETNTINSSSIQDQSNSNNPQTSV